MSEQVLKNGNVVARSKTRTITQIAMLGAIAGVLMNLEFPLPFLAPSFYQLDFSNSCTGRIICNGTYRRSTDRTGKDSGASGIKGNYDSRCRRCAANFIFGCTFAVPAGLIYRYRIY